MSKKSVQKNQIQNKSMNVSKIVGSLALVMGLFLATALPAVASEKAEYEDVFINGYKLGFFEQLALEDHIDRDIPDGNYWFELDTGMWGPVGGTAIGRIEVPEDYQDYVKSKFANQSQATVIELSASAAEECGSSCLYW
jgi:hypothetical protein